MKLTPDRIGDFFAKILDLEIGAIETTLNETEIKQNLNETVVFENRVNDVEFLPVVEPVPSLPDVDEIDVDESDIDEKVSLNCYAKIFFSLFFWWRVST